MTSVIVNENEDPSLIGQGKKSERTVPIELQEIRKRILKYLKKRLSPVEWRAMGVENVGGPTIQVRANLHRHPFFFSYMFCLCNEGFARV